MSLFHPFLGSQRSCRPSGDEQGSPALSPPNHNMLWSPLRGPQMQGPLQHCSYEGVNGWARRRPWSRPVREGLHPGRSRGARSAPGPCLGPR